MALHTADFGGLIGQIMVYLIIILFLVAMVAILYFVGTQLWRVLKYKVKVDIYEHLGEDNHIGRSDLAEEVTTEKDGKRVSYLKLLKSHKKAGPFSSDKFMQFGRMKKIHLHLVDGLFTAMPIKHNSDAGLTFEKSDLLTALQLWDQDYAENLATHNLDNNNFWDKYGSIMMNGGMILIMFVLFFVLIQQMQSGVNVTATLDTSQLILTQAT